MHRISAWACAIVSVLACAPAASAQDAGRIGVTMGYPASVGLLWHITDRVAVRPELSFGFGDTDLDPISSLIGGDTEASSNSIGTGASVLVYLRNDGALRTYVAPRFTYSRTSSTTERTGVSIVFPSVVPIPITSRTETTGTSVGGSGLFGAEYKLHDRFAVFGEVGFGYTTSELSSETTPRPPLGVELTTRTHNWSTRSGIGVTLYF